MRALALLFAAGALALSVALSVAPTVSARVGAECAAADKQAAQATLAAYRKAMSKQRAAYFRKHKTAKLRKAYVQKQQAKLKKLRVAAACTVVDAVPPQLLSASIDGATVYAVFSEAVTTRGATFVVRVNGKATSPATVRAESETVALTLPQPVVGDDAITLDYAAGVVDAAGNAAQPAANVVVANATPAPCSFMVGNGGLAGPGAMNEGPTDLTVHQPAVGELRGIVLWVDFSDAPATESIVTLTDQIIRPAIDAYASMAYGKLTLRLDAATRWYRLPQPSAYYGLNVADERSHRDEYIATAVRAADADIDFSVYDAVYLVPAAGASADHASSTQRSRGSGLVTVDGKELRHAILVGSDRLAQPTHGSEQLIHETGHVLGLPDLYSDPTALGGWDPMSFSVYPGAELMAWHRWKLGWLEPSQVRCVAAGRSVQATLAPLEPQGGVKMLVAPLDATRAIVVENRQALGLDTRLCDKGILVYSVVGDAAWPTVPVRVLPARPGRPIDQAQERKCGPLYDATLDLGAGETPTLYDDPTGVRVELVASVGGSYTVRVSRT